MRLQSQVFEEALSVSSHTTHSAIKHKQQVDRERRFKKVARDTSFWHAQAVNDMAKSGTGSWNKKGKRSGR